MTPEDFLERVRSENRTALSRLGSSKALYADTMGEVESEPARRAAVEAAAAAAETFEAWAADGDGEAAETFLSVAESERARAETIAADLDGGNAPEVEEVPAVHGYLRDLADDVERAGGFVGWTLVAERSISQLTAFFVGQADPTAGQQFREMGDGIDDYRERGLDLLASLAADDADRDRAFEAATGAIQAAYDEYTERLESMGVNPKPVC